MKSMSDVCRKKRCFKQLHVRGDTMELVMRECYDAFMKDNPGYQRLRITHDFMVRRIALYYLHRIDMFGKENLESK